MPKRVLTGRVKSDKMDKTRVVQIARLVKHPKYGKYYRDRTTCYVHDENNESKEGDTVQIIEAAPKSKKKRWALVKVVEQSSDVDVAAMKAARKLAAERDSDETETTAETENQATETEAPEVAPESAGEGGDES